MWEEYLLLHHKNDIFNIIKDADTNKWFSININFLELFDRNKHLCSNVLNDFDKAIEEFNESVVNVQKQLQSDGVLKRNIQFRIFGLPSCTELNRVAFPTNNDLGKLLQISGTVIRITALKLLEYERQYVCKKCKQAVTVKADYEQYYVITPPTFCNNKECRSGQFVSGDLKMNSCKDYQEIKVQEQINRLGLGSMPRSMWITLENDLVDTCKPGDNVIVCGVIKRRWKQSFAKKKWDIQLVMKANHIHVNNEWSFSITPGLKDVCAQFWEEHTKTPLFGRDFILKSLCPELFGLYVAKLAVALILAGGSSALKCNSGVHTRSEPHLLLVGDPGIGKSQLLRRASKINPRSVLTTGVGSTSAGLTVAAFMEDGEWHLEAGALVLSDGGICCIDEFNSMKEHDRTSIHEAMEQQTISIAKAGIVSKLNTRCSILAATNPKFNLESLTSLNLNIASPLLSRFDLVLIMKDVMNDEWNESVADYILNGHKNDSTESDVSLWSLEMLQVYFATIKKLNPVLSLKANQILCSYYQMKRRASTRNKARTTVRLLDSLVRLSQAHARLMFRSVVEVMDAVFIVSLVETSVSPENSSLLNLNDYLQFPDDPTKLYTDLIKSVLNNLNLNEILSEELEKLQNINISDDATVLNISNVISEIERDKTIASKFETTKSYETNTKNTSEENIATKVFVTATDQLEENNLEKHNQIFFETNTRKRKKTNCIDVKIKHAYRNRNDGNQVLSNDQLLNLIPSATDECDMQVIMNGFNESEETVEVLMENINQVSTNKIITSANKINFEENNYDDFDFGI